MPFPIKTTEEYAREGVAFRFVIELPPITKKNSSRLVIMKRKDGSAFPMAFPSDQAKAWTKFAVQVIKAQAREQGFERAWDRPVSVQALFLRGSAYRSDLNNYTAIVGDALQAAGILEDDQLIRSWDGSRIGVSYVKPRTEILLRPMPTPAMMVELEPETNAEAKRRNANRRVALKSDSTMGYPLRPNKGRHAPVLVADRELARQLKLPTPTDRPLERRPEERPTPELLEKDDLTLEHGDPLTPEMDELLAGLHDPE